ncbi:MAG: tetratricopeptide repeat protein [Opitutales bacterium]
MAVLRRWSSGLFLVFFLWVSNLAGQLPDPLTFDGIPFDRVETAADPSGVLNRYVASANPGRPWEAELVFRFYYERSNAAEAVRQHAARIEANVPGSRVGSQVLPDEQTGVVRYLLPDREGIPGGLFEIWVYRVVPGTVPMLRSVQWAVRPKDPTDGAFLQAVADKRKSWTRELLALDLPLPRHEVNEAAARELEKEAARLFREDEAIEAFNRLYGVIELDPVNGQRRLNLGALLFTYARELEDAGRSKEAGDFFREAEVQLLTAAQLYERFNPKAPAYAQVLYLLGDIYHFVYEDTERSRKHYIAAIRVDPNHQRARRAIREQFN